jgi:cell wall assembly regulator SMI1
MQMAVSDSWAKIEAWLDANAPTLRKSLRPPAKAAALDKLQAKLGLALPADYVESVRVHDGQKDDTDHGLFPGGKWVLGALPSCRLLTLAEIGSEWRMMKELLDEGNFDDAKSQPERGIRNDWWNLGWIPIADNGGGDYICLDMAPAKSGTAGQVILFFHDMDERRLLAKSYRAWLDKLAKGLASGQYVLDEDAGLVDK